MESRRGFLAAIAGASVGLAGCQSRDSHGTLTTDRRTTTTRTFEVDETATPVDPDTLHVSPQGETNASGTQDDPLASIYEAAKRAEPGETVQVASGEYREHMYLEEGGEPGNPLTITGPRDAVIRPTIDDDGVAEIPGMPIFRIRDSHIHLRGMTVNGLGDPAHEGDGDWYSATVDVKPLEDDDYLEDLVIMPDAIGNATGGLIGTSLIKNAEIGGFEVIGPAGVQQLFGDKSGHVGEIVYLGTAPKNLQDDDYYWDTIDETQNVHVHHIDNSAGHPHAELVDAKPGTRNILIEYCSDLGGSGAYTLPGHEEGDEAAVSLTGNDSTLRYSIIANGNGNAVEVGSWDAAHPDDFEENTGEELPEALLETGKGHAIYGNEFRNNYGLAIEYRTEHGEIVDGMGPDAQRVVCGNEYNGDTHGDPDRPCGDVPAGDGIGYTGGDSPW